MATATAEIRPPQLGQEPDDVVAPVEDERKYLASQWQLMWWRFLRHRLAIIACFAIGFFYMLAAFAEFFAPLDPFHSVAQRAFQPPQRVRLFDEGRLRPFVYAMSYQRNPVTLMPEHTPDVDNKIYIKFFTRGHPYKLLGLFPTDIHLFGPDRADVGFHLLGTDGLGRDFLSRLTHSFRISTTIGLVGVAISMFLGVLLGGVSAYGGRWADAGVQRLIELFISIPTLPLWLTLSAALPTTWPVVKTYLAITIILSLRGWTGVARQVRGRFLSLKQEDFVVAARLCGSQPLKIIFRHMLPSFLSHIIATLTLAVPLMIIGETSLSFLGLGLRAPAISLGVLLKDAQNVMSVANAPWLLSPGLFVLIIVLSFNFLGDGLRDAAAPYSRASGKGG